MSVTKFECPKGNHPYARKTRAGWKCTKCGKVVRP